ncbi:uncharacterized protein BKA78DRAFT_171578 [Phyllosticta capitalensis]|uniref:Zn(2)-C6 fungal-type domain-containing protein n=1 Tax=Phyllosticta capitalensis TaxID=121624 RepID=A0ABR1YA92_9PEZI
MASKGTRRRKESQNLSQSHTPTAATTSQTPSTSADRSELSRRASLAPAPSPSTPGERSDDATSPQPPDRPKTKTPRSHVTAVACSPCQHRKSKCDGKRPTCSSCEARGRTDCVYDMAGDQRRTSSLKQTIVKLEQENQTLKEVIQEICMAQDTRSAVEVARRLPVKDFQGLQDVAALLKRRQSTIDDAVGERALAESRAGRNSAEESMDIGDVAPQDINIDPVLKSANTTHGAPMPFPPPASLDRAALSNSKGPAQFVHIKSPVRSVKTFRMKGCDICLVTIADISKAWQDASRSNGSLSVSSPSTPSFTYATEPSQDLLTQTSTSGSGVFHSSKDGHCQNSVRYVHSESLYCPSVLWVGKTFGVPQGDRQTGRDQVKCAPLPVSSLQPLDMVVADPFTAQVTHFIQRKRDLLAYPVGWLSERVLGDTGDAINAQLMYLMEGGIPAPIEDLTVTEFAASVVGQMSFPSRAERLAIFYLMVNFLNWRILPTEEHHDMIPDCVKPTAEQSLVPHPAWVDCLPWPRLRSEFISRPDLARRGNALSAFSQYTRVNWPSEYALPFDYGARDWRVEELGPALEQLPDAFKAHVADVNNWSLDPGVVNLYRDIVFVDKVWIQPLEAAEMSHDSMMFDV